MLSGRGSHERPDKAVYLKKGFFGKKIEMLPFSKKRHEEF
jgi:hypothetical protein